MDRFPRYLRKAVQHSARPHPRRPRTMLPACEPPHASLAGLALLLSGSDRNGWLGLDQSDIEFTVGPSSINVDTTRVDRFGLKLALLLHGHDGSNQEVGEDYATFQESHSATSNPANFYQAAPANYYAQFWHRSAINGLQYGFPYDDDAGSPRTSR